MRRRHPTWCAQDHTCSAGRMPDGQHRGRLETWHGWRGERLVWTRFQYERDRANGVEVRIVVGLPTDDLAARTAAQHVAGLLLAALNQAASTTPAGRAHAGGVR